MLLEYYITGGKLRIGKKEFSFEMLRKDSALRFLLGQDAGVPASFTAKPVRTDAQGDFIMLDFKERKLGDDPTRMLNELKQRYGSLVGGKLYFKLIYTTYKLDCNLEADLDANEVSLCISH
jgi:hypothetical protein